MAAWQSQRQDDPVLSVVVPTRNEQGNVARLCALLGEVLPDEAMEVLFVDDSDDGTPDEVSRAAGRSVRPIRLLHRLPEQRRNGLGGAVVEGIRAARGTWVCVMDADLQHPPAVIARMLERATGGGYDLVVGSRFQPEGDADQFGALRRALSWLSKRGARALFPDRLRAVSDPMSGFFLVRKAAVDLDRLHPRGFKILVEILVRTPRLRVSEVGFHFGERFSGESKAGAREAGRYLAQLVSARAGDTPLRFVRFGLVGLSGLVVNTLALALFTAEVGIYYVLSAILATQVSTAWNYALTERWVFHGRESGRRPSHRAALFFATNNAAMLIRIPLLALLASGLGINYLLANVLSLVALTLARFALADAWIWGTRQPGEQRARRTGLWCYDIHGIITVASEARLPELERFLVDELFGKPTIAVGVGRIAGTRAVADGSPGHHTATGCAPARIQYTEGLRRLGFGVDIEMSDCINVRASRLVGLSPHVLYTNVVEPILRWSFAERGYALVHAACIAEGDRAWLITARTDTGKTTTSLKVLDSGPYRFLSDDLTLLCPDGRVLTYPKPLTISRHTLHAVRTPLLSRRERVGLVLQSRLHSRSGRRFALLLAKTHLPAATINAITQIVVPPPKFQVDRLVPGTCIASEARVAGLVVIQRGGDGEETLTPEETLTTLLENCEDAYGFPPYPDIEHFLHSRDGAQLQAIERATIAQALEGIEGRLLRSDTMDWAVRLPRILDGGQDDSFDASSRTAPGRELAPEIASDG
jgi:putative flippase GtrA